MGYYVDITGVDFTIPADKLDAACQALKDLNKRDDLKTGGSYGKLPDGSYGQTERWFAWMPADYHETHHTVQAILQEVGFEFDDSTGDVEITGYSNKSGAEEHFLAALSPFVKPGSYVEWEGEDGERWRDEYGGEEVVHRTGRTVWE